MKLKRVKIYGFKTFADKTEFDMDGDIIAVVGPNGCGKSNIVDAILWGLGETSVKALRASNSQEVIFNGSGARKALGFAEVSLLFDNEDGTLPIDTAEVTVSRKLNRAGDSDYQINKRDCRLRDVGDLLADSGLGRAGYAIVSQSDIDQALSASPQQRRAWIDEAAGVQRYRARRTESLRRLETARQHLARIHDILSEIESQRAPLEREAEMARRYKLAVGRLREVELGLLIRDLATAAEEITDLDVRIEQALKLADAEMDRARDLEKQAEAAAQAAQAQERLIEQLREAQARAQALLEQAGATVQVNQHKLDTLDNVERELAGESGQWEARKAEAEVDVTQSRAAEEEEKSRREKLREELGGADGEAKALASELRRVEAALIAARKAQAERQKHELEMEHRKTRLRQINREIEGISETLPDLEEGLAEAERRLAETEAAVEQAQGALRALDEAARAARRAEDEAGHETRQILAQIAAMEGKRRGLEATIDAHEGLAQGAKAVLAAVDQGLLEREYTPVAEAVTVDSDLAQAIDTALGGSANDLIVPEPRYAQAAIELLKRNRLGRATFQPITLMRPSGTTPDLRQVLNERGVIGLASDLVDCENRVRPVIDSLLGRVVIVETLDDALRLARTRGWSRMVTREGEVVHSSGAVTGGQSQRQGAGMVQRKAELEDLEHEIRAAQDQLAKLEKAREAREKAAAASLGDVGPLKAALEEAQQERDEARAWMLNLKHEFTTTKNSQQRLESERAQLTAIPKEALDGADPEPLEAERDELMRRLAAKTSDADTANERLAEADARLSQAIRLRQEAERRLSHLVDAERHRARRTENLEPEREKARLLLTQAQADVERLSGEVDGLRAQVMAAIEAKKSRGQEEMEFREQARNAEKLATATGQTLHDAELKRARADSKRTAAVERLLEEYGVNEEEALAQAEGLLVPDDAAAVVSSLRREIKGMGEVNLGAIEAYERLTERYDELNHQVQDVEGGIEETQGSIRELDRLTRERFKTTFEQLQVAFAETYTRLLGGGEAQLELSEAENILDSGVEISVTIPGKRRQRLELLSGGERAMSALAFLFSLLKVKPSPLVILDEVDAPLDGRNVERFVAMMREFSSTIQFVLITHNPVTIESADVWFGVTMQEPGVSTLVPFKVPAGVSMLSHAPESGGMVDPASVSLKG